jgi:nitric oxide reductase NorQ protein
MSEKTATAGAAKRVGGRRARSSRAKGGRLGPGELDKLVLGYMRRHKNDAPHSPSAVAKGIKRSSGAVANCLDRLAAAEKVRQAAKKPRRYELTDNTK